METSKNTQMELHAWDLNRWTDFDAECVQWNFKPILAMELGYDLYILVLIFMLFLKVCKDPGELKYDKKFH